MFIITGCSHSGICNILEYAKKVCNDDRIYGVIDGFHLFEVDERLGKTIDYLNVKLLYPCHCVSLKAKIEMTKRLDINEVGVGLELKYLKKVIVCPLLGHHIDRKLELLCFEF